MISMHTIIIMVFFTILSSIRSIVEILVIHIAMNQILYITWSSQIGVSDKYELNEDPNYPDTI